MTAAATRFAGCFGPEVIVDGLGRPVVRVPVDIFTVDANLAATATRATLYAKHDRSVSLANPLPQDVGDDQYGLDQRGNVEFFADVDVYWMQWSDGGVTRGKRIFVGRFPWEPSGYGGDWVTGTLYPAGTVVNVPGSPSTQWVARRDVAPSSVSPAAGADWAALPPQGIQGPTGAAGPQGVQGPQGVPGTNGAGTARFG